MSKTLKSLLVTSVSVGVLCAYTVPAMAQDNGASTVEEITVTARKREETIRDVPFSINAQSMKDIERANAQNLEDVARNVAGLQIQNLGPGQSQVAIRGVSAGQIARDQPGVKEQVGVYLDESAISLSLFTPDLDLYDLSRVEVLRGPQGTLFGSGSIGGTIRYITNQPVLEETQGSFEADLNQIDGGGTGGSVKGMVNVPLSEKAAFRAVAYYTEYGGFIDAQLESGGEIENVNSGDRMGGRLSLLFQPSDEVKITPRIIYQEIDVDGFNRQEVFNLFANPYTTTRTPVQLGEREQHLILREGFKDETMIADLKLEASFSNFDVTSITSYTDRDVLVSRDSTTLTSSVTIDFGTLFGFPTDEASQSLPSNLRDTTQVEQWTQELRLSSNGDGPLQWLVGAFYQNTDRAYNQSLPTPGFDETVQNVAAAGPGGVAGIIPTADVTRAGIAPVDSPFFSNLNYSLEQYAVFGELSYDLTERLQVTAGGRWYDYSEDRVIDQVGVFGSGTVGRVDKTNSDGFTPRFLATYDVSEEVTVNAQVSRGFRLGGVNDPLNAGVCNPQDLEIFGGFQNYDDEKLWNYEAGVKIQSGNTSFNAAAYYTDISNLQVTLDSGSCNSRISFNVEEAHTMGLEAELRTRPVEGLDLVFAGSLLEAEFDSTVVDGTGTVLNGVRDGNRLPTVPETSFSVGATYSWDVEVGGGALAYISGTFQYRDTIFTQPSDQEPGAGEFASGLAFGGATGEDVTSLDLELDSYETMNVSAGLEFESYEISAYVTNLFDENANLSFDRERGGRARLGFRTNQPRTFGVVLRAKF